MALQRVPGGESSVPSNRGHIFCNVFSEGRSFLRGQFCIPRCDWCILALQKSDHFGLGTRVESYSKPSLRPLE